MLSRRALPAHVGAASALCFAVAIRLVFGGVGTVTSLIVPYAVVRVYGLIAAAGSIL